ncbi:hypothetical protein [Nodosilinea nodulosa]|uniref:hypothetical protein n=1 Tax=Nodosilinea nodulosa TaxID=416001 RepID=UPI0003135D48|nr:hypothetical protein [Nodosilinea nodulosa]
MPQPQNQPPKHHPSKLDEASDALMHLAAQMGIDPSDPLVLVARGNARLEEKVEQWTQTNLQLLELLSQQVEEQQRSAQHYSKLIYYLNGFDGQLLCLQQQIETALSSLSRWAPDTPIGTELAQIKQATTTIQQTTQALGVTLKSLSTGDSRLQLPNLSPSKSLPRLSFRAGAIGGLAIALVALSLWQFNEVEFIKQRVTWSQIKLQRLEQVMGLDSRG